MSFLLDTNICSAHLRRPAGLAHQFEQYAGRLSVPSIVLAELFAGAYHLPDPAPLLRKLNDLIEDLQVLDFNRQCAEQFGVIRGTLLQQGISINTVDLMIASVAFAHDLTLVTHNTKDFQNIPGLRLEDWLTP